MSGSVRIVNSITETFTLEPSIDTSAYADGDVFFDTEGITIRSSGVVGNTSGEITFCRVVDTDDLKADFDILFLKTNVSIGTENAAVSVSDTNAKKIIGRIIVRSYYDLGGAGIAEASGSIVPFKLLPVDGVSTLYIAGVCRGTPNFSSASAIHLNLGVVVY